MESAEAMLAGFRLAVVVLLNKIITLLQKGEEKDMFA
jgi:hypothetical protein